jgi:tetratricopeptide (TPR) repeat protein
VFIVVMLAAALTASGQKPCDRAHSDIARQNGERAFEKGQFTEAATSFERAFGACPAEHSLLLRLSEAESRRHDGAEAIGAANRFLALEPSSVPGRVALANAYFMAQRFPDALRTAESVLEISHDEPAALKIKGNVEYLSGQSENAIETFLALLDQHPQDADGAYMLGRIYYQEGQVDQASGQFQRVLKLDPTSYKALDNLGLCYQARGDREMAKRYFLTAIKVSENKGEPYDWSYANLANLLLENGDAERAFAAASKAVERNPYSARNFYLGGKALQQMGKDDLSINWLERSVSLDAKYPEPLYLLAKIYKQRDEAAKAAATLEKFRIVKAAEPRERK